MFPGEVSYTITIHYSSGTVSDQVLVDPDCCVDDLCSTLNCDQSFVRGEDYSVTVTSSNAFGRSLPSSSFRIGMKASIIILYIN
jgi:hypothetical protein